MKQYTDMIGKDKNSPEFQLQTERYVLDDTDLEGRVI
jgi:hypothetical protein